MGMVATSPDKILPSANKEPARVVYIHPERIAGPLQTSGVPLQAPELPDQHIQHLENKISEHLTRRGNPTSPAEVSVDKTPVLTGINELGGEIVDRTRELVTTNLSYLNPNQSELSRGERVGPGSEGLNVAGEKTAKIRQFIQRKAKEAA